MLRNQMLIEQNRKCGPIHGNFCCTRCNTLACRPHLHEVLNSAPQLPPSWHLSDLISPRCGFSRYNHCDTTHGCPGSKLSENFPARNRNRAATKLLTLKRCQRCSNFIFKAQLYFAPSYPNVHVHMDFISKHSTLKLWAICKLRTRHMGYQIGAAQYHFTN